MTESNYFFPRKHIYIALMNEPENEPFMSELIQKCTIFPKQFRDNEKLIDFDETLINYCLNKFTT